MTSEEFVFILASAGTITILILGWISKRWDVGMWTGLGWPRTGTGGGRLRAQ